MITLRNRALLAPMSGITDLPFRRLVFRLGAGLVIAEMVAGKLLAGEHRKTLHRVMGAAEISPYIIQISGRDPHHMAKAAKVAADLGADVVDINMGCPARKVIKGQGGAALMAQPELAQTIIESVVGAVNLPVTLKMRLGWDESLLNAPQIAMQAEQAGIQMFTVHGRTRNQFYSGHADWLAIRKVVEAVKVPVIANGDIITFRDVKDCLAQSGAHGIMIGRGAQGRPWIVGEYGARLAGTPPPFKPTSEAKKDLIVEHYEDMLSFYGLGIGLRHARKHLGWYVDDLFAENRTAKTWRARLYREENPANVLKLIDQMFDELGTQHEVVA